MGGSSVDPKDLAHKYHHVSTEDLNHARWARLTQIRQHLGEVKKCCVQWSESPVFYQGEAIRLLDQIDRLARPSERQEPQLDLRMALEDRMVNATMPLRMRLERGLIDAETFRRLNRTFWAYAQLWKAEHQRQACPLR